uniref:Chromosome 17 open reading frame 50 n=1 Tax=Rhinolophus ferrumequinum TaxID=59479 RepID=A0A671G1R7_RHIFE
MGACSDLLPARRREDPLVEERTGGARGQGGGGGVCGGGVGGGRPGEAAAGERGRGRSGVPGGRGRRRPRAGLGVLLPAAPGVQHPAAGAAAARGLRLLGLAQPLRAARQPGGSGRQKAEPLGGAVRAGDAATTTPRRGLCALRDPFLQEMQDPAQPSGLRGALYSGAPGPG